MSIRESPGYKIAPKHEREGERLEELYRLGVLDTQTEERFDRITRLVSKTLGFPTVLVSLIDQNRQWFKSACGLDVRETARDVAFCAHALHQANDLLLIPDAKADSRFQGNPLVTGPPYIRTYVGVLLRSPQGLPLGTLCAIDYTPRQIDANTVACLQDFAEIVKYELYRRATDTAWLNLTSRVSSADLPSLAMNASDFRSTANQLLLINDDNNCVATFICDIPKFETINRTFGHTVSSELLLEIARRIRLAISSRRFLLGRDLPHRFVGLVDLSSPNDSLEQIADELSFAIGNRIQTSTTAISTPINIGLTLFASSDDSIDSSIQRAQFAIDDIATTSSGLVTSIFSPERHNRMIRCYSIAAALETAVNDGTIHVVFQPKVSLKGNRVIGAEALMRWTDEQLGPISPLEVLAAAQKIDFIPLLDEGILKRLCQQLTDWLGRGRNVLPISINLSGTTFMRPNFIDRVTTILSDYQLPFHLIDFEILESSIFENIDQAVEKIRALRALGITFSLDDFGTGHSSLAYLQALPINTLKMDRSFITDIVQGASHSSMVRHIIEIGHTLNMNIVAEGVENIGQYLILRSYGCDSIQGYYLARPMAAPDFEHLISSKSAYIPAPGLENL